jgi:hypothetical protein
MTADDELSDDANSVRDRLRKVGELIDESERLGHTREEVPEKILKVRDAADLLTRVEMDWRRLHGIGDP